MVIFVENGEINWQVICEIAFNNRMESYLGAMFNNRNISTMNVLSQDSLFSKKFTNKWDIIEARNAS